jgi:DNA adenine methylase
MKPPIKWVGSKRQLLPEIRKYYPKEFNFYYEPFLGAGSVLFDLQPKNAIVNDINEELINCYIQIKNNPDKVVDFLKQLPNTEQQYYHIRNLDKQDNYRLFNDEFRAARFIYINKNGFNGLWRVNKQNKCNVPYGKHKSEYKPDVETIMNVSNYLQNNNINFFNIDFELVLKSAQKGDFIYYDSPYWPLSETSNFTNYTKDGFTKDDQIRLRNCFKELSERGCYCSLSNSYCDFILDLYKDFNIIEIQAKRNVNCDGEKRGKISEVLIKNY